MLINYEGKEYDTDKPNRLQLTDDNDLKQAVINQYFDEDVMMSTQQDLIFQLALISARYETIISAVTDGQLSYAGTYPDWVLKAFHEKYVHREARDAD